MTDEFTAEADADGRLEVVCEQARPSPAHVRPFNVRDGFGVVAEGLEPGEQVTVRVVGREDS